MNISRSKELFKKSQYLIPGGVNSPVRAFKSVGGSPLFIDRGIGSHIFDVDSNSYIDYVCSWGPLILGHAHPDIIETIKKTAEKGTTFGASTELELILAEMIVEAVDSIEMVRLVSSGTEALMSAIRLARGYTGRNKIIKFEGCYHGHSDCLLAKAGSGVATFGLPDSAGVPAGVTSDTIVLPYNDVNAVSDTLNEIGNEVAAILVEPVAGNMGVVLQKKDYLASLRKLCDKFGVLLIFDEVITGFRVAYGGAQSVYGVMPDITTLGKVIGGGLPVGAYGGRREIMECISPVGPVYQAGTLSGNPLAVSAGIATIKLLQEKDFYKKLDAKAKLLEDGIRDAAKSAGIPVQTNRIGSIMTFFFNENPVCNYAAAKLSDTAQYARFFAHMLENGIYLAPSQFEAAFVSQAHTQNDIEQTINSAKIALKAIN